MALFRQPAVGEESHRPVKRNRLYHHNLLPLKPYAKATEHDERAFELVRDAILLFTTVTTFRDWRILAVRSTAGDKTDATNRFGNDILNRYQIPPQILIASLARWFIKHPILLTGSIIMNIYIRIFPLKREIVKDGIWIPTSSSKQNIVVRNS